MRLRFWIATLAVCLATSGVAYAQLQSGNISGTVTDEQGAVLPGATVTLQGTGPSQTFLTDDSGQFRFLALPPGTYKLTATLQGFRTLVRDGIVVAVGQNVQLPLTLGVATVQETVTVSGESPIVDTKAMGTATNFTQDELSRIPNSRDPWALLRTVPGVVMDRVNIAGNETGQQSAFNGKGARTADAVWNLDGVEITDMAAIGASPTYFDYDAYDEIQISTGGNDIRQRTGGIGLNFVVKRGTNQYKGSVKGYFTSDGLEGSNVPDELKQRGLTSDTSDHNDQISEYGFDAGGPIVKDRAWVWGSYVRQDIRLLRSAGNLIDRTLLITRNVKGNWQATTKDMVSILWFLGSKVKENRATGNAQVEPSSARWLQGDAFPESRPHGLLKFQDDRVLSSTNFLSVKYAYYGTGFQLSPQGGLDNQAGISGRLGQTFGSTLLAEFLRPQHSFYADANTFKTFGANSHDFKYGFGWRRSDAFSRTLWPGDRVVAFDQSATNKFANVYREGAGTNRVELWHVYVGDTITTGPATIDLGVRYDRQGGSALPSETRSNGAFPTLVPGIKFDGYDAPFTWSNVSPRAGVTIALDDSRRTLFRGSFSRFAGQISTGFIGWANPSGSVGFAQYPWTDLNGDNLAQPNEVDTSRLLSFGGGFNPANPTAVTSANRFDEGFEAPITTNLIVGIDRELIPNLAVALNYTYGRTTNWDAVPWFGLTAADYAAGTPLTGTLPGGATHNVPTFIPDAVKVRANGNSRVLTNWEGFATNFHGLEGQVIKRMSNRWMMRVGASWNNATEDYDASRPVTTLGNPTRSDTDRLQSGGQYAPRSAGSGQGDVFVNAKWQVNLNGLYQLPWESEVAGNLFGRQGNPFPVFRFAALGVDGTQRILVSPELDAFRFDKTWNLDLRWAKTFRAPRAGARLEFDLFNVFNNNVELQRERNAGSPNFRRLNQILSPRILRIGVRLTFG